MNRIEMTERQTLSYFISQNENDSFSFNGPFCQVRRKHFGWNYWDSRQEKNTWNRICTFYVHIYLFRINGVLRDVFRLANGTWPLGSTGNNRRIFRSVCITFVHTYTCKVHTKMEIGFRHSTCGMEQSYKNQFLRNIQCIDRTSGSGNRTVQLYTGMYILVCRNDTYYGVQLDTSETLALWRSDTANGHTCMVACRTRTDYHSSSGKCTETTRISWYIRILRSNRNNIGDSGYSTSVHTQYICETYAGLGTTKSDDTYGTVRNGIYYIHIHIPTGHIYTTFHKCRNIYVLAGSTENITRYEDIRFQNELVGMQLPYNGICKRTASLLPRLPRNMGKNSLRWTSALRNRTYSIPLVQNIECGIQ